MRKLYTCLLVLGLLVGVAENARAIATADNSISADDPANYGYTLNWDYVYKFRNSSSVAIDHYWILTAAHVADDGASGNLMINGDTYTPQETVYHPSADLALVRFDKPFPGYYPLHDGEIHNGKTGPQRVWDELILSGFGRTGAVTAVTFENDSGQGTKRWGTNEGTGETTANAIVGGSAGSRSTVCFTTSFVLVDTPYEAGAAQYDSGGPVFIERDGEWRVAGISLYLDGSNPFYTGNYIGKIAEYRSWIIDNIPDYDTDMDGLPDWWELQYGGDETSMEAGVDSDGDGLTNYEEWIADTDPTDGNSYLRISAYTNASEIVFSSSTDRQYQIEFRTDFADTNESWQAEPGLEWFDAVSTQTVKSVSTASSNRFFRVDVQLP